MESELREFLEQHPHLIPMQMEIDRNLQKINSRENRLYYLNVEMFDSLHDMLDKLKEATAILEKLK